MNNDTPTEISQAAKDAAQQIDEIVGIEYWYVREFKEAEELIQRAIDTATAQLRKELDRANSTAGESMKEAVAQNDQAWKFCEERDALQTRLDAATCEVLALREALRLSTGDLEGIIEDSTWTDEGLEAVEQQIATNEKLIGAHDYAHLVAVPCEEWEALKKAGERLKWLHTCGVPGQPDKDENGFEWGIYKVKWDDSGKLVDVDQTFSDMSDLDAAMAADKGGLTSPS